MSGTASPGKAASNTWMGQEERSNMAILRLMVWISLTFGRPLGRLVLHGIAAYFTLFSPQARRASRQYLEKVLGRPAGWKDCFLHVLAFASTIHDRIYLLHDRFDLFEIEVVGAEALLAQLERQPGALLMGAHLGSFEVLRAMGRSQAGLRVAMLMYEENARKINATLEAINPRATQDILPLGQVDSMLKAQEMLDHGCLVGMLADRGLGGDGRRSLDFLGSPAGFPTGPFRVAALLRRPVFFMTGLYLGGNRYRLHFEPLADFSQISRGERAAAMDEAMAAYAARLEQHCRQAPYNWFNFFNFWQ